MRYDVSEYGAKGDGGTLDNIAKKDRVVIATSKSTFIQQRLGREVAAWSVVLMQYVNGDTIGRSAGCLGKFLFPNILPAITDANPIDGTQYYRLALTEHDNAPSAERIFNFSRRRIGHGATDGRRRIDVERRDAQ